MRAGANGASGKSAKRRQWRKKRADFEEVPRLAATTVAGNRLARRWAAAAPYEVLSINGAQGSASRTTRPALYRTPCKKRCHCEASAHTGCGERAERCQWQEKRGERVAAVKISSVRHKAAQKFWAPQQGHPRPPVLLALLPEGGWHGAAVTGGFFFAPHRVDRVVRPFTRFRWGDPWGRPPHDHCTLM